MTDEMNMPSNGYDDASQPGAELFYGNSVKSTARLLKAMKVEGIDQELALLRSRFKELTEEENADIETLLRAAEMIGRTVIRRHRISPARADEFAGNVGAALKSITDQLFPERLEV